MVHSRLLGALLALLAMAAADTTYDDNEMQNDSQKIIRDSNPLWYLSSGSCYPEAAEDGNGGQTDGVSSPGCSINNLAKGCTHQIPFQGFDISGPIVPVYYGMKYCGARPDKNIPQSYRVFYALYFKQDIGHKSDWEWASIIFTKGGDGRWRRESVYMEQDGAVEEKYWEELETFEGDSDKTYDGQVGFNHPKFYVAKFHHDIHHDKKTSFKSDCLASFRNKDFYLWNSDSSYLKDWGQLNADWNWGGAAGNPQGLMGFGRYAGQDICYKEPTKPKPPCSPVFGCKL